VPTISDVAARAGVSTATVSRALNGKPTVDPDLAARVRTAATELGYQPNGPARNLRRQEAAVVALIISDVENPFFTAIARGVEDVAHAAGYSVVLCNSDESGEKENRYIVVAIQERVAGVILSPSGTTTSVAKLAGRGTAYVAVDRPLPEQDSDVVVDTRLAARQATAHLVAQGYERIGCVTGPAGVRTADDRLAGYREALKSARRRSTTTLVRRAEYKRPVRTKPLWTSSPNRNHRTPFWSPTVRWRSASCRPFRSAGSGRAATSGWSPSMTPVGRADRSAFRRRATCVRDRHGRRTHAAGENRRQPATATTLGARLIERASSRR